MRYARMDERFSATERSYALGQIAWQAAEAALMDAQFDIRGPNASGSQRMALFSENNTSVFLPGCNTSSDHRGLW